VAGVSGEVSLAVQIPITMLVAVIFDLIFQYKMQLIYSGVTTGAGPTRYSLAYPFRFVLMSVYLIPLNVLLRNPPVSPNVVCFLLLAGFLGYLAYTARAAIMLVKEKRSPN
jgi:hypothetical protein